MVVVGNYMSFELTEDFSALLQEAGFEFVREEEVKRGSSVGPRQRSAADRARDSKQEIKVKATETL